MAHIQTFTIPTSTYKRFKASADAAGSPWLIEMNAAIQEFLALPDVDARLHAYTVPDERHRLITNHKMDTDLQRALRQKAFRCNDNSINVSAIIAAALNWQLEVIGAAPVQAPSLPTTRAPIPVSSTPTQRTQTKKLRL